MHREIDGPEDHVLDDKWGYNKDELWVYRGLYAEFKVGGWWAVTAKALFT